MGHVEYEVPSRHARAKAESLRERGLPRKGPPGDINVGLVTI